MAKPDQAQKPEMRGKNKPKQEVEERIEGEIKFADGIPAEVKEIVGRAGTRGELTQVMCQVQEGFDKNKVIRRNVKGPVQPGDILMLLESEIEAQRLGGGIRKSGPSNNARQ